MKYKNLYKAMHYIAMLVLTVTLIVTLSFAWYVSNTKVSANGITATTESSDLEIVNHGIYLYEEATENKPYPDSCVDISKNNIEQTGILPQTKMYYSISIRSKDLAKKTIRVYASGVDGGQFFFQNSFKVNDHSPTEQLLEGRYQEVIVKVPSKDENGKDILISEKRRYQLFMDSNLNPDNVSNFPIKNTNGAFYKTNKDGKIILEGNDTPKGEPYYRNYLYEESDGTRLNCCDIYTFKLEDVFFGTGDGTTNIASEKISSNPIHIIKERIKVNLEGGGIKEVETMRGINTELGSYLWTPKPDTDVITLRFLIVADGWKTLGSNVSYESMSFKKLRLSNILVKSEVA